MINLITQRQNDCFISLFRKMIVIASRSRRRQKLNVNYNHPFQAVETYPATEFAFNRAQILTKCSLLR